MKILHLCFSCTYVDGYNYQENMLPRINKEDGHDVRILASTETYINNADHRYLEPKEYVTEYGVPIKRLPYVRIGNHVLTTKIRKYPHVFEEIESFSPDVIMIHSMAFWSVLDVIRYKKTHPEVKLYADTHTSAYNSGTNWPSLHILHRIYYRWLIQKALPYLEKYFYIGESERLFSIENYGVPEAIMEYYPLGGTLLSDEDYQRTRAIRRQELGIADDQHLYIHSGKMGPQKRTKELLEAFSAVDDPQAVLVIIGSIPDTLKPIILPLIEADSRVEYLGWKSGEELQEYLCAGDLYCQPWSASATMQNAICRNCAIMAYPRLSYTTHLDWGNILWIKSREDMESVFRSIAADPKQLLRLKQNSRRCAEELLDYRRLAARLYE